MFQNLRGLLVPGALFICSLSAQVIDSGSATDQYFTGGAAYTIAGASGDATLRYGNFSYRIPTQPGLYQVVLTLRETGTVSAPGQRAFTVKINGQETNIERFDLFAASGLAPLGKTLYAVSNGFIRIEFATTIKSAVVSSIEVKPYAPGGSVGPSGPQGIPGPTGPPGPQGPPGTSGSATTFPVVTQWASCKSGLVVAGAIGPGVPFPTAAWPGLMPFPYNAANNSVPVGWSCDGLQMYKFRLKDGTADGPYVAVKMPADFVVDPTLWVTQ